MSEKINADNLSTNTPAEDNELENLQDFVIIGTKLLGYTGKLENIVIPKGVTKIVSKALEVIHTKRVVIPETVTQISIDVLVKSSPTAVCELRFKGTVAQWCKIDFCDFDLNDIACGRYDFMPISIIDGEHIHDLVIPDGIAKINKGIFWFSDIESVKFPETMREIGCASFFKCSRLKQLIIPNGVKSIDNYAFFGCSNLKHIYIPASVKKIGAKAFAKCYNAVIYCEAKNRPRGWSKSWYNLEDESRNAVIWGV